MKTYIRLTVETVSSTPNLQSGLKLRDLNAAQNILTSEWVAWGFAQKAFTFETRGPSPNWIHQASPIEQSNKMILNQ